MPKILRKISTVCLAFTSFLFRNGRVINIIKGSKKTSGTSCKGCNIQKYVNEASFQVDRNTIFNLECFHLPFQFRVQRRIFNFLALQNRSFQSCLQHICFILNDHRTAHFKAQSCNFFEIHVDLKGKMYPTLWWS